MPHERIFDAGRSQDEERHPRLRHAVEQHADLGFGTLVRDVDHERVGILRERKIERGLGVVFGAGDRGRRQQRHRLRGLGPRCAGACRPPASASSGARSWWGDGRCGAPCRRGCGARTACRTSNSGELGRPDDDRDRPLAELAPGEVHHAPEGADRRRRVEGRAHLVMQDRCAAAAERLERARDDAVHLVGREAPTVARDADRLQALEPGQQRRARGRR